MLSPVKMYKQDMKSQKKARTWGPKGKPYKGCKGSICYRHKNVDWTVHRLAPAIHERAPVGSRRRRAIAGALQHPSSKSKIVKGNRSLVKKIDKRLEKAPDRVKKSKHLNKVLDTVHNGVPTLEGMSHKDASHAGSFLQKSSPRWGEGKVPSRMEGRHAVPLPKKGQAEISKKTYAGAAIAIGGGAYAYHHRKEIKAKAHQFAEKHPHFVRGIHSSHAH